MFSSAASKLYFNQSTFKVNKAFTAGGLPIQKGMLNIILGKTEERFLKDCSQQPYLCALNKAFFSSAYYGMLRISKITSGAHPMLAVDVHVASNKNKILFVLRTSKTHWTDNKPQLIKITSTQNRNTAKGRDFCPFIILKEFVSFGPTCRDFREPFLCLCRPNTSQASTYEGNLQIATSGYWCE